MLGCFLCAIALAAQLISAEPSDVCDVCHCSYSHIDNCDTSIAEFPINIPTSTTYFEMLSCEQVTEIEPFAFDGLVALSKISLASAKITSIPPGLFRQCTSLSDINIGGPMTTLPAGLFKGLINLPASNFAIGSGNFTFGGNTLAPPSTYGSASSFLRNCLYCSNSIACTTCYDGFELTGAGACALPGQDSSSSSTAIIAGAAGGCAALLLLLVVLVLVARRQRRAKRLEAPYASAGSITYMNPLELAPQKERPSEQYASIDNHDDPHRTYEEISTRAPLSYDDVKSSAQPQSAQPLEGTYAETDPLTSSFFRTTVDKSHTNYANVTGILSADHVEQL
ncbi:hypothetical protein CAOG_04057 [Capsaspora owczarzaki ATCC 30864]|uniref:hypothetical protein n=1 Tax=Capsaspora owczarzaki (strain ATCC 30864) TaxID=595528 RepID=UPI0001FE4581|nr:hypothetical protein CAOG_04057 [Capsaspora owczarzaki ATCC 30864]|eukprot:XP_004347882.1 hypothetical protein CAOG_04057 [Capsaspora owczarzaki ATCC 30864]